MTFLFCAALKASPLVQLQLEAPAQCPSNDAIERALARLVQRPPAAPLVVNARLAPAGQRWVLVASLEGGQRVVGADSCNAAAEALVVIMALAIDPLSPVRASALLDVEHANEGNAPVQQSAPAPAAPKSLATPRTAGGGWRLMEEPQAPASVPPWHSKKADRFGLAWGMLGEWGSLPKPTLGGALFIRYGSPLRWGEVAISGLYPRIRYESGSSTKGAQIGWFASQVGGCSAPGHGWPIAGCLGMELGDLIGHGVNTDADRTEHTLWTALTAGFVYRGDLGNDWGLEVRWGVAIPIRRRDFGIEGPSALRFTPGPVSGRGLIGVSWH